MTPKHNELLKKAYFWMLPNINMAKDKNCPKNTKIAKKDDHQIYASRESNVRRAVTICAVPQYSS